MNDDILNDIALEKACKHYFALDISVEEVIVRNVPTGVASRGTLFRTSKNIHYLYIGSQSNLTLGDVQRIVRSMQFEAEIFLPPRKDADYFKRIGIAKYKEMFPGKYITSDDDIRYYQTLAPYNPALVRIARVKGEIRGYDIATQLWRKIKDYAYTKMKINL
jgi:hypothetical protein